jgi:hypothetical protein
VTARYVKVRLERKRAVTACYVKVRLERKRAVLDTYHKALFTLGLRQERGKEAEGQQLPPMPSERGAAQERRKKRHEPER